MTKGIGIDAVEIDRIREARARHPRAFPARVLGEEEMRLLDATPNPDEFLAGRFAAKEAVMKLLGTGWAQGVRFRDIEVLRGPEGIPLVTLREAAAVRARSLGIRQVLVSITHTKSLAMAVATGA